MKNFEEFSADLSRIFSNPESLTRRQGAIFAARLSEFLHQKSGPASSYVTLWSFTSSTQQTADLCPQARFMEQLDQVLAQGLDQMRSDLLDSFSSESCEQACSDESDWQALTERFLQPMTRLAAFSRVLRACLCPMRAWLETSVFIGHRRLCLADQIRQSCLDRLLKRVVPKISRSIFWTMHRGESKWSSCELEPVHQYTRVLFEYQRFQTYLASSAHFSGPFDSWDVEHRETRIPITTLTNEQFNVASVFVEPYLECLRQFYRPFLQPFDAQIAARSIDDWLNTEEKLAIECNIVRFRESVVSCLLEAAVKDHLNSYGKALRQLMEKNDQDGTSLFFRVMVTVEGGLDHLLEVLREFVKAKMLQMFGSIKEVFESLDPSSAKATSMYIEGCVNEMRSCREMIDATATHPSLNRNHLMGIVKTGIADVFNSNPLVDAIRHPASYTAAALAHNFHRQMRTFRTLDSNYRDVICDFMILYSLLLDKEAFLLRYHSLLRERLLSEGCDHVSLDAETFAIEKFTEISGWKAVYEVKSVLKDFKESEEFNARLRSHPDYQNLQRGLFGGVIPTKFTFVRGYFWRMEAETVRLPTMLSPVVEFATQAYQANHTGRVVSFAYHYGSGLLSFNPTDSAVKWGSEEVILRCSTAVMLLLLHFNEADCLSGDALVEKTRMRSVDVQFYLHHLVRADLLVLGDADGTFTVNDGFRSSAKQVNLMVSQQQQQSQKQRRRLEKLDERMKEKRVQCAIVSVMKQLRHLTKSDLFQMVQSQLLQSPLHSNFFADQLAYLISGGYIRVSSEASDETGESVLEYVP